MLKKDLTSIVSNGVFRLICVYADKFPPYTIEAAKKYGDFSAEI